MSRRVLVTGGSGFIGTNLVERFRASADVEVLNYDHRPPRCPDHASSWVRGDLEPGAPLPAVLEEFRPQHLVHLAARTDLTGRSMADYATNVHGLEYVLESATRYGRLQRAIYASSRLVCDYGQPPTHRFDYSPPNFYARSKVIGEQLVREHDHRGGWVIVRPTSIWGPYGQSPYREFFLSVAAGRYLHPGHRRVLKHYGYVGNTVHQIDALLTAPAELVERRTLYLADPPIEVGEFAATIRAAIGKPPPRRVPVKVLEVVARGMDAVTATVGVPMPLGMDRLRHLTEDMLFDLADLAEIVGPLPYTMQQGVAATVEHLQATGELAGPAGVPSAPPAGVDGERVDQAPALRQG